MSAAPAELRTATEYGIPTEFRYWDHVGDRPVQLARKVWRAVWRFDPQPPDEYVERFARAYYDSDPVAEAFVDEVYTTRGANEGRRLLDQALEHGLESIDDPPASMRRLFEEFERDPGWLRPELVERGARVFRRYGTSVFSFATTSTLEMYSESSITKPLSLSGGYAGDTAHKRQLETVRFWIDVSDPGGLDKGPPVARGRATAMRVRIMHVFIRRRLMQHPEWDLEAWGVPISIADATLTLMGGSVVPGLALWSVGHQTTISEIEALLHYWRYIGHLLGVQPDWYPEDFRQSVQLMYAAFVKRAYMAGRDGEELVQSYLPAFAPKPGSPLRKRIRDELNYRVQIGYTRFWMLPMTYRRHEMPNPWPWAIHPLVQFPFVLTLESVRRVLPPLDHAADRVQRWRRDNWYANETGGKDAEFKPVEEFRR
ncbi:MAG TPA: oxygenase MpaB family protein [Solirubrobacteraceae bacterium]|nr:oxygenase MpaB family protein [Solirubrobacteraceae bacterium]